MFPASSFGKHLASSSSPRPRRRQAAQKRRPVRLALEPLEQRLVPTVVTNGHELAVAIDANNNSGGNVTLTLGNSFTLQNNAAFGVEISKGSVTISGLGRTLTASAASRLFQVDKGASLTINNATLTGGDVKSTFFGAAKGGAILDLGGKVTLSGGTVVLSNAVNANSPISGTAEGGGVFVSAGGTLTIAGGSAIQNNSAVGSVNVTSAVGHSLNNAEGGGIYVSGGSTLTVTNSRIFGNLAQGSNAIESYGAGGIVVATAGFALGGGVYLAGRIPAAPSAATFTAALIYNNTAHGGAGASPVTASKGKPATGAGTDGGAAKGGGIFASASSLTFAGSVSGNGATQVYGNKALGGAGGDAGTPAKFSTGFSGGGGGLALGGGVYEIFGVSLSIGYTSLSTNMAKGGVGGAGGKGADSGSTGHDGGQGGAGGIASGGAASLSIGGGILATIVNSSLTGNSAIGGTGGMGGAGGSGTLGNGKVGATGNGGSASGGGAAIGANAASLINIINTTVAVNLAQGGGSAVGFGSGGGIWFSGAGTMQLINDTVYSNTVTGGGIYTSTLRAGGVNATPLVGGGVLAFNTLFISNVNPNGYADTSFFPQFGVPGGGVVGSGNYITTSFLPTIKVVSLTSSSVEGLIYYALESGTPAVNGGANSLTGTAPLTPVLGGKLAQVIANAEGVPYNPLQPEQGVTDEIGDSRFTNNGIFGISCDVGAVAFNLNAPPPSPTSTIISVLPVNITTSNIFTPLTFLATVTATSGNPVIEGVVTFTVTTANGTPVGSPAAGVRTGIGTWSTTTGPALATTYILPGNTPAGTYFINAVYTDPYNPPATFGLFGGSNNLANPALLTINPTPAAPAVTTQPGNTSVVEGSTVLFKAAATGTPAAAVQWYQSSDGGVTFTSILGATSTTLTLSKVTLAMNNNQYEAVFTNSAGTVTTTVAVLTVTPKPAAPTVTGSPSSATVVAGDTAVFTASANGTPTPTVQWKVSSDGGKTFASITGATSATLTLSSTTTAMNNNQYEAVFTNSAGTATTTAALLTVTPKPVAPTVTGNPNSATVTAGGAAVFAASANGTPTPTVQWKVSSDGGAIYTSLSGATSTTLTLSSTTTAMNNNQYEAVFTNSAGTATTTAALLTVTPKPVAPTVTGNPNSATVTAGDTAVFTAAANGTPDPTVQWEVSTDGGKTFASITGATGTTLTLTNTTTAMNNNQYEAVFTNSAGTATTTAAQLTVASAAVAPMVAIQPQNETIAAGNIALFTATANGTPAPTVQWYVSSDFGATFSPIVGATSTTLVIPSIPLQWSGYQYQAVFTNSAGAVTTTAAHLTVNPTPSTMPTTPTTPTSSAASQSPYQVAVAVALDTAALLLQGNSTALLQLNSLSLLFAGEALPPTNELYPIIVSELNSSAGAASIGLQFGFSIAGMYTSTQSS